MKKFILSLQDMYNELANALNGNARDVWDDLRVSVQTGKVPAANYPGWDQITDDGAGSVGTYAYHFADGEYIWLHTQLPHSWKEGTTIYPHIHFMTTSDVDPTDNFGIGIECLRN